jgi:hypothetical protein
VSAHFHCRSCQYVLTLLSPTSRGGSHFGPDILRSGLNSLSQAITRLDLQPRAGGGALHLDYATSSLGALDQVLLRALRRASRGTPTTTPPPRVPRVPRVRRRNALVGKGGGGDGDDEGGKEETTLARVNLPAAPSTARRSRGKSGAAQAITLRAEAEKEDDDGDDDGDEHPKVRVHFPSARTVQRSRGGPDAAGTITANTEHYARPAFPRAALRDHASTRAGLLSHGKVLLAHSESSSSGGGKVTAWAYVGSANLSASAWGRVVADRAAGGAPKLVLANWECGVLVPVPAAAAESGNGNGNSTGIYGDGSGEDAQAKGVADKSRPPLHEDGARLRRLFAPVLDVPFQLPGKRYGAEDKPWFFLDGHRGGWH